MLVAVENTPSVHNLIVCTLCSCYPVAILGVSPAWYKSRAYRQALSRHLNSIPLTPNPSYPDRGLAGSDRQQRSQRYVRLKGRAAQPWGPESWGSPRWFKRLLQSEGQQLECGCSCKCMSGGAANAGQKRTKTWACEDSFTLMPEGQNYNF